MLSTRHQWFPCGRLSDPHLTRSGRAFSETLTTGALDPSRSRWFGACLRRPAPRDLPSSRTDIAWRTVVGIAHISSIPQPVGNGLRGYHFFGQEGTTCDIGVSPFLSPQTPSAQGRRAFGATRMLPGGVGTTRRESGTLSGRKRHPAFRRLSIARMGKSVYRLMNLPNSWSYGLASNGLTIPPWGVRVFVPLKSCRSITPARRRLQIRSRRSPSRTRRPRSFISFR